MSTSLTHRPPPDAPGEAVRLPETTRLEAFSDGVFAIAITLLVLEIKVPNGQDVSQFGGLWPALASRWASYLGYTISFVTIGIMWANHHSIFQYVRHTDRRFLLVNVLFLMGIGFLPFPTAVLATHLPIPADRVAATMFYGATLVAIALLFNAVWWAGIWKGRLLGSDIDRDGVRVITERYRLGPISYLVALGVAPLSVWLSLGIHLALALFFSRGERPGA
jgi:TMEM175 potassium channel family protein